MSGEALAACPSAACREQTPPDPLAVAAVELGGYGTALAVPMRKECE